MKVWRVIILTIACILRGGGRGLGFFFLPTVSFLLQHILRFRAKTVRMQIELAFPDKSPAEQTDIMKGFYRFCGVILLEFLKLPGISQSRLVASTVIDNEEVVKTALEGNKGVCILAGHIGCWELIIAAMRARGYPLHVIGKELKSVPGEALRMLIRDDNGVPTIPRRNGIRQVIRALKDNALVVFVLDQNMTSDEGTFVDFFGAPACTSTSLAALCRRTGAPVIPARVFTDENGTHRCEFLDVVELPDAQENLQDTLQQDTQIFTTILENIIRRNPSQWLWNHKRWRTWPEEQSGPTLPY